MLSILWIIAVLACCSLAQQAGPIVDLSYSQYQGYYNATLDQNIFRGIRYAAPPVGERRWQYCSPPVQNRSQVFQATSNPPICPQSRQAPGPPMNATSGDEDCLFLNVFAPANATKLPVLMLIHGGGFNVGSIRSLDLGDQIRTNENSYIGVVIQYRLGAFGFLASGELAHSGLLNAGIHDMRYALQWIQKYIHLFGGDPEQVTIGGLSSGATAVMHLAMSHGGNDTLFFNGLIAADPYLGTQWDFDDAWPSEAYYRFAKQAGCMPDVLTTFGSVFECLVAADTATLQIASDHVTATTRYARWAFEPVTDGYLLPARPTTQLLSGKLNGVRILSASIQNDGVPFTSQDVNNETDFRRLLHENYPLLSPANITSILGLYGVPNDVPAIQANSDGLRAPFATTNSIYGFGWQQAANNLINEATFACASYWLATGFAQKPGGQAWQYQYSVSPAGHRSDTAPLLAGSGVPATDGTTWALRSAMQHAWGNFIVHGVPGLAPVRGGELPATIGQTGLADGGRWAPWTGKPGEDRMLNFNMTGGVPVPSVVTIGGRNITIVRNLPGPDSAPPLHPIVNVVDGYGWEDGRGKRCQLLADLGPWLME